MKVKSVVMTATQARENFFDLINAAYYADQETIILKNGNQVAVIKPPQKVDWEGHINEIKNMKPFLNDSDVEEYKQMRRDLNKPRFPKW